MANKQKAAAKAPARTVASPKPSLGRAPTIQPSPAAEPPDNDPFDDPVAEQITGNILQHHEAANRNSVDVRAEVGRLLLDLRQRIPHGSFGAYLSAKVPFTPKTAERAINLYRFKQKQPALFNKLAAVGISKAYVLIGLPLSAIEELVANAHTPPSVGVAKPLSAMTYSEFMEVITADSAKPTNANPGLNNFHRASRALVRTLNLLIDQPPTLNAIELDHLHHRYQLLRGTLSRLASTFQLTSQ